MAIEVQGQILLRFSVADYTDFIQESDLSVFLMIEESGNLLPTFQLSFYTLFEDIISYLHEGNEFIVSFGKDRNSLIDVPLHITKLIFHKSGRNKFYIRVNGVMKSIAYVTETHQRSIKGSGIEVIKKIVSEYFIYPQSNLQKSDDSQVWLQPNITDKKFVNELWLHSYIPNSFIAVGISSDGYFIVKDIKADLAEDVKWRFGANIPYDSDYVVEVDSGFINAWMGYGKELQVYDLEKGEENLIKEIPNPIIAQTLHMPRTNISSRFGGSEIQTGNQHTNYYKAYYQNLSQLASFNTVRLTVSYVNSFLNMRVLDRVHFKDIDIQDTGIARASEIISGYYYIQKISRNIANRQIATVVTLCRESLNQIRSVQ